MSRAPIAFESVWKKFRKGERHDSLRDLVPATLRSLFRRRPAAETDNDFWVLRDASFEVQRGEAFGIIGPNGAGKSTSLKLLTRIMRPNRGVCRAEGRVGALIEVTAGFHPDLTGRENVYLQGAIMGMRRAEIARRFDQIIDFAGLPGFVDTPVKRYSSGMSARLGFSIAAHLSPDVLIIDEVLAVGDLAFQERCYARMEQFKREGVAIVLVSHNFAAVGQVCDRAGVLKGGELQVYDNARAAISSYSTSALGHAEGDTKQGSIAVVDRRGHAVSTVQYGETFEVVATMSSAGRKTGVTSAIRIRRAETGEQVYMTTSTSVGAQPQAARDGSRVTVRWQLQAHMARGHYSIELQLLETGQRLPLATLTAPLLSVEENETEWGSVCLGAACSVDVQSHPETVAV